MPITRARKEELVAEYKALLDESTGFAIVYADRLSVPRVERIRRAMLDAGGLYVVTKNTLMTKALEQSGWIVPEDLLVGKTAIIFGRDNFPGVAKSLLQLIKDEALDEQIFNIKGGVMGGTQILNPEGVKAASELPTLPEIQSQILGLLVAPSQQLVSVLHAANSGIVNVLQAADSSVVNVLQAWIYKQEQDGDAA